MIEIEDIRGYLEAESCPENDIQPFESAKRAQPEIKLEKLNSTVKTPQEEIDAEKVKEEENS